MNKSILERSPTLTHFTRASRDVIKLSSSSSKLIACINRSGKNSE